MSRKIPYALAAALLAAGLVSGTIASSAASQDSDHFHFATGICCNVR
jgi:hypothetical protein